MARAEAFIAAQGLTGKLAVELETRTLEEVATALEILASGAAPHVTRCAGRARCMHRSIASA